MHFRHKAHNACCARDIENLTSVSQNMGYFHQYNTKIVNSFFIKIFFLIFFNMHCFWAKSRHFCVFHNIDR